MKAEPRMKLAVYDMDRTITRAPTWTPWLLHWGRRAAPWRLILLPVAALLALGYAARLYDRARLKELTQALMMGGSVTPARLDPVVAAFADRNAAGNTLAGALASIARDRADGYRIVLATASCHFYADELAARWGIADVIATANHRAADGALLARLDGPNCYGAAKLRLVQDWMRARGLDRADCHVRAYSDHVSDAPLLAWADEAIAANASPALATLAATRGWRVEDWR